MSALGLIHDIYHGGVVYNALSQPSKANHHQRAIWQILKEFGKAVAAASRERRLPVASLPVWRASLVVGLVGRNSFYAVFCDWPGVPTVHTQNLDGEDPPSIDAILEGTRIDFADPSYAFSLPVEVLDAENPVKVADIQGLVGEFFDYHLGVKRRDSDQPRGAEMLLTLMGKSRSDPEPEAGWRVRIGGVNPELETLLAEYFTSEALRIGREDGRLYVRSSQFSRYTQSLDVLNHGNQLLHLVSGLLEIWLGSPTDVRAETAELVGTDGTIEGQLGGLPLNLAVWSRGGRDALRSPGVEGRGSLADSLVDLALQNATAHRILKVVAQTDSSWGDLYTIVDSIEAELGGRPKLIALGWASGGELTLFDRTANTADLGRHAQKFVPPRNPMSLPRARETVFRIARAWLSYALAG